MNTQWRQPSKFYSINPMKQQRQELSYKKLNELRKNATLCDFTIKTVDGDIIHVHKYVLMSNCMYFEKMFSEKSKDDDQKCIHVLDIDGDILHNLIDYIYTGTLIQIHEESVERILKGADILQLFDVQDLCIEFLLRSINGENWLKIKKIADSRMMFNMPNVCFKWALKNFDEVFRCAGFLTLDIEQLKQLIDSDELYTVKEENVYIAVIIWVRHDEINRKHFLPELMKLVRVPLMNYMYVHRLLQEEPLITSNRICFEYLTKIHKDMFYQHNKTPNHDTVRRTQRGFITRSLPCLSYYVTENETEEYDSSPNLNTENIPE
ncbi:kelch-like protein 2 isoform X2 [Acyrthosiphon pisum]|uniref:BTB domain-containing protein n=1 Tax=Acyrthosiphon pisum TaxID=7029 RepID=A0A8R1W4R7_ACYPI|nr:kelch-like protein 2 isoform X1 [Acyrthosiphon pisum]XP_029342661.1 kelch-like protein 2 isoform X2 [Acyrthosiphon pisum]|eukprot:XP_003240816.1 PREDICTED: kelch-like protein 2 isoform X1 [Acyrthosiphon pisum]